MKILRLIPLLLLCSPIWGATYYVSHSAGADTNNGTAKATPWKHAPGMFTCTGNCSSATINAGDSIILEGCDTWGENSSDDAFPWMPTTSGTSGNPIYIGVDKTWYNTSVCPSAWNRPILNPNGQTTDPGSFGIENLIDSTRVSYVTWDNFEVTNWYTYPDTTSGSHESHVFYVSAAGHGASFITIENMYVHHWIAPAISIGTGNLTASSCTITNFVPYSYSPSPLSAWTSIPGGVLVQALPQGTDIPEGNNTPVVTSITGSNPYTIVFTNTAGCPSGSHTGDVIQIGIDTGIIVSGYTAGDTGTIVENNVFDGSDTAEVAWNGPVNDPAYDCSTNNQACMSSVEAGRYGPQIWLNNVIRYVSNGFIGSSTIVGGNLIEYVRLGTNPTGHTNAWEDEPCLGNSCFYYNNVVRHLNWVGATGIPGGPGQVGVPFMVSPGSSSATAYLFNNVMSDATQNDVIETNGDQSLAGAVDLWNNTVQGGPDSGANYLAFHCTTASCLIQNNLGVTTQTSPYGTGGTFHTNLAMTPSTAAGLGLGISQTYAFAPISGSLGTGTANATICGVVSGINATVGAFCPDDTNYAVGYNTSNHTVIVPGRASNVRASTPNISAYEYSAGAPGTAANGILTGLPF